MSVKSCDVCQKGLGNDTCMVFQVSSGTRQVVTWVKEENYMFAMSKFKDRLLDWLSPDGMFGRKMCKN